MRQAVHQTMMSNESLNDGLIPPQGLALMSKTHLIHMDLSDLRYSLT